MANVKDLTNVKDFIDKTTELKGNWSTRNKKIKEWYDILLLTDELKQEGMESVASNDPRTGYNLGKHLVTSSTVAHKISDEGLTPQEVTATSYMEGYITRRWFNEEKKYRSRGRQSFKSELVGLMMSTGWVAIFSMVEPDKIWTEIWNPYEVFPEFGSDGLIEVAHIYSLSAIAANRKVKTMGWSVPKPFTGGVTAYNYWGFDDDGDVANGTVLGETFVKPLVKDVALSNLTQKLGVGILPVFITPVGGLPDMGAITAKWQEHFGESIVAVNEDMGKNYNKMLSFTQQIVRDVANPRWFEQSSGDVPILREEDLFKRGAIFRGAPGEAINPLPMPAIPVELRTTMFEYSNMIQRGLFPWALYGNVQMQMSYLAMANVASSALQILTPYMDAYRGILGDIDNYQTQMILQNGFRPYGFKLPKNLPEEFEFDVQAEIEIPGYLIQRATVARMLNPNFRLPERFIIDKLFPEIRDPIRSQAQVRSEDAMMIPEAIMVDAIIAYREQARILSEAGDKDSSALYEKLAASLESKLGPVPQQPARTTKRAGIPQVAQEVVPPTEVQPTGATQPLEGLGGI